MNQNPTHRKATIADLRAIVYYFFVGYLLPLLSLRTSFNIIFFCNIKKIYSHVLGFI
jgi:hypothetical protein